MSRSKIMDLALISYQLDYHKYATSIVHTFIIRFVDTYASWHVISVVVLSKSGEGNGIFDKHCVWFSPWYQRSICFVQWELIDFHWAPRGYFTNKGIFYSIWFNAVPSSFTMTFHQITNMTWKLLRVPMYKQPDIETVHIFGFVALFLLLPMVVNPSQIVWA